MIQIETVRIEVAQLFVYGTLMQGERAHALLEASALVRKASAPRCHLLDLGGCPGMVRGLGGPVQGEVYNVPGKVLEALDKYENTPTMYRRELVRLEDGSEVFTYIYRPIPGEVRPLIRSGSWRYRG